MGEFSIGEDLLPTGLHRLVFYRHVPSNILKMSDRGILCKGGYHQMTLYKDTLQGHCKRTLYKDTL